MTIAFVGAGANVDSSSGSPSVGYPGSIATNDLLVICGRVRSTGGAIAAPASTLTWTEQAAQGTAHKLWTAVYDGIAAAPTLATGGQFMGAFMLALRGVDTSNPVGAHAVSSISQANMHYPALTVPADGSLILTFTSVGAAASAVTPAAGFTQAALMNSALTTLGLYAQYLIQTSLANIIATDLVTTPGTVATQLGMTISFNAPASGGGSSGSNTSGGFSDAVGGFGG